MNKMQLTTTGKKILGDIYTPVGIYLRLRDRFRDTILLESTDHHANENSYSFICINAIGGIEVKNNDTIEYKLPGNDPVKLSLDKKINVPQYLWDFMRNFEVDKLTDNQYQFAQGLYGYTCFDAVPFFDTAIASKPTKPLIPLIRYRLYQYVIAFNHFKDELIICENKIAGLEGDLQMIETLIRSKDVPVYPFSLVGTERSNMTNESYIELVKKGIKRCLRGDVFQIVLSRKFEHSFSGDEFNVYRALRSINPSPYLFFFDYGDYKIMGSSPEAQLVIKNGKAIVHPIAGTFKRTGDDTTDQLAAEDLLKDKKENAEHVMLVDLARNDLSRVCDEVNVVHYRQVQYYSHVIHLVSEVEGKLRAAHNPFEIFAGTFPAGTLSGAPKVKALEIIAEYEPTPRSFYGGAIGFVGFDGSFNHAIMIRTFLSKNNQLICQAGAGVVAASNPENELQEVNNKLNALKQAAAFAAQVH
ncbi:MAG: anthranilate synthase component I [Sphingobacteriia bacterium 24-36-13]|uniref:anthranilate synthase component I family protein n=1 Tax=Sediminibacterium sp. TaxID=1917865 RepID=UPI000BDD932A|nr:anthranilate synthase component I family protein [Sediminibacterium sp.]OYZ53767.1 MAG: anthranilate synthase component I [Sphingobacteriia bacterium 24-36-13]OZA65740.1 MAG: anthranilate synthase component I [Sphingobacteriia bacterium 39-36-14]HQS24497.1 anthranilate synthase component I family protein [Sediminibacterium sp.]HQS34321.1 anthranilate synthase component I family protein [Sediminibacterium sp.]